MNDWDKYIFIYKNSVGRFNTCTNTVFITEHKCCYGLKRVDILEEFRTINYFIDCINDYPISKNTREFMNIQQIK